MSPVKGLPQGGNSAKICLAKKGKSAPVNESGADAGRGKNRKLSQGMELCRKETNARDYWNAKTRPCRSQIVKRIDGAGTAPRKQRRRNLIGILRRADVTASSCRRFGKRGQKCLCEPSHALC